ncbi:MAG TPA: VOC family protein [Candidatus Tetragenococcus pullicola]|nr:VOC family protein [Candidatus Tetragenococcus pullicola]
MKMAHTCVRVKDLNASLDFYNQAFGFEEKSRRDFPDGKFTLVYLSLPGDDYELELTYNYDHPSYELGDGYGHIAIAVDDVKSLHEKHSQKNFDVTDMKGLPENEPSYYFIKDPDGYKIEVVANK